MLILDDLILAPFKGILSIAKEVQKIAEEEINSEKKWKEEIAYWDELYRRKEISKKEYEHKIDIILNKLNQIKKNKKYGN